MIPRKTTANLFAAEHPSRRFRVMWLAAWAIAIAIATDLGSGVAWAAGSPVAEVSLTIGVSRLIDEDGHSSAIVRGMPVHAGERVETEEGGHVHLRFVDGAFVSVRPGSRLIIETYRYDPARPQDSAIRFTLERGVARAISGKGAEAARDRFRLNTPIAAIGVRGTDFVAASDDSATRVAVRSGAVQRPQTSVAGGSSAGRGGETSGSGVGASGGTAVWPCVSATTGSTGTHDAQPPPSSSPLGSLMPLPATLRGSPGAG